MGKIWFETNSGFKIHLPIVGADYNTPDNPVLFSGIGLATADRYLSGEIAVNHPVIGSFTLDFGAPGRTGKCNQCGQCCSHPVANCPHPTDCAYVPVTSNKKDYHACQYLRLLPGKGIGKIGGTECSIRASIIDQFKGCALSPMKASEIETWMTACGFTFSG
jgi:hypothetical protein